MSSTPRPSGVTIIWTDSAGGTNLRWWSNPLQAVTIAGLVTANIRGLESALTVNSGVNVGVAKTNIGGTGAVNVVVTAISTEWTASETAKSVTGTPASGVALLDGDRLRIDIQLKNVGTMAAGTATLFVGGPTSGASGDSFITFTETLLEYVVPPSRAYLQAVKRAAYW
jgi:hypothetical protein